MKATDAQIAARGEVRERMGDTGIRLPTGAMQNREPGHIIEQGWHIGYLWDKGTARSSGSCWSRTWRWTMCTFAGGHRAARRTSPPQTIGSCFPRARRFRGRRGQRLGRSKQPGNLCRTPERGLLPPEGENLPLMEINEFLNSGGTIDDGNEVSPVERNDRTKR